MKTRRQRRSRGLILLVVLGMLSLFSFLAVTYVVFASQSRTASVAMANRDLRGTPPEKLMDFAIRQVIRGTTDHRSALWHNGLLDDMYGVGESALTLTARINQAGHDRPGRVFGDSPSYPTVVPTGSPLGPQLYGGHLLKIPLQWSIDLPRQHDAWTGRVVTFSGGPLANQSLRVIRYIGEIESANFAPLVPYLGVQYSILVDLSEINERLVTIGSTTRTIAQWASLEANGASLVYSSFPSGGNLTSPYSFFVNGGIFNSFGSGVNSAGTAQTAAAAAGGTRMGTPIVAPFDTVEDALLPHHSYSRAYNPSYSPNGDVDETYDAADYQNFFLSLISPPTSGALTADNIAPSFHRPAVINYIASRFTGGTPSGTLDLAAIPNAAPGPQQFLAFLDLVQRATARPVSCSIANFPIFNVTRMVNGNPVNFLEFNPYFTGGNNLVTIGGTSRNPQLVFNWANRAAEQGLFDSWLRWQTRGNWDVDNDGDGLNDSVWVDLNFPLMTSPEGKLLKILAAFYIEDMDGKLDLNASGGQQQTGSYAQTLSTTDYAYRTGNASIQWPQGLGFGTADISLRHLLSSDTEYTNLMLRRYAGTPGTFNVDDGPSSVITRGWRRKNDEQYTFGGSSYYVLPVLPMSTSSRIGLAIDLLGNTRTLNTTSITEPWDERRDDPYDSRILRGAHDDTPYTVAAWERLVRFNDWDRSSLSRNLQQTTGTSFAVSAINKIRSISPRNAALTLPSFPATYSYLGSTNKQVGSFVEFVEAMAQGQDRFKTIPGIQYPYMTGSAFAQLFPLEFRQNRPLDLNRPFGNGVDDIDASGVGNGVVDEATEADLVLGNRARYWNTATNTMDYMGPLYSNDYTSGASGAFDTVSTTGYAGDEARQLLARHLYCLAQLILPMKPDSSVPPKYLNSYIFPNQVDTTVPVDNATRARILAQWAVNVVDFRDNDAAMTRFPYDPDPFFNAAGSLSLAWDVSAGDVVFGFEQPELLLTESLATHDVRIRHRPGTSNPKVYDQFRVPEGSLFLELFCPRSTATSGPTDMLPGGAPPMWDTAHGGLRGLDIAAVVPATGTTPEYPVWRVLVLDPKKDSGTEFPQEIFADKDKRYLHSYQIDGKPAGLPYKVGDPASKDPKVDRVIWFSSTIPVPPAGANPGNLPMGLAAERVFRYQPSFTKEDLNYTQTRPYLRYGEYLVIGPRPVTYFGSRTAGASGRPNNPNYHRIELMGPTGLQNWVQLWDGDNVPGYRVPGSRIAGAPMVNPAPTGLVLPCKTMIVGANAPAGWPDRDPADGVNPIIGINISEPIPDGNYYAVPRAKVDPADSTGDSTIPAPGFQNIPPDAYIDYNGVGDIRQPLDANGTTNFLQDRGWTFDGDSVPQIETKENWSAAVLQRLANPGRPWHANLNPYITVDWIPIDLTVFSGEETVTPTGTVKLATRQKSGMYIATTNATPEANNPAVPSTTFFSYATQSIPTTSDSGAAASRYFKHELAMEIKDAATTVGPHGVTPEVRGPTGTVPFATLGYLNRRFELRGATNVAEFDSNYPGAPQITPVAPYFPNRDFVNALELTSVPITSAGSFMQEFSADPLANGVNYPVFRHLLDYEQIFGGTASPTNKKSAAILLETVGVPSPWPDAWTVVNPITTAASGGSDVAKDTALMAYRAPYNWIPSYREPGRVNLNTITQANVVHGLMWGAMATTAGDRNTATPIYADAIKAARQQIASTNPPFSAGTTGIKSGGGNPNLDANYPTEYPGVWTSTLAVDKFPVPTMNSFNASAMTLLRRRPGAPAQRVFKSAEIQTLDLTGTLANNSFFANYPAARLANLTTNKSNVYGVRMTLGYFEFDPGTGIGSEYGADQGRSKRNRSFYLIDRSIPVGYQMGQDFNTENCIIARRIVE